MILKNIKYLEIQKERCARVALMFFVNKEIYPNIHWYYVKKDGYLITGAICLTHIKKSEYGILLTGYKSHKSGNVKNFSHFPNYSKFRIMTGDGAACLPISRNLYLS